MFAEQAVEFDIFAHLWDFNSTGHDSPINVPLEDAEKNDLEALLRPKTILWEGGDVNPKKLLGGLRRGKEASSCLWQASQFYSTMRSAHLKRNYEIENGFEYDVCIRGRTDLVFSRETPETLAAFTLPKANTLNVVHAYFDYDLGVFRTGDLFYYGDSPTFDAASQFFRFLNEYPVSAMMFRDKLAPPEVAFQRYLERRRIGEEYVPAEPQLRRPPEYEAVLKREGRPLGRHETF